MHIVHFKFNNNFKFTRWGGGQIWLNFGRAHPDFAMANPKIMTSKWSLISYGMNEAINMTKQQMSIRGGVVINPSLNFHYFAFVSLPINNNGLMEWLTKITAGLK